MKIIDNTIFTNDNNVNIKLINHNFSNYFVMRDNHEIMFRRINTYLIKNKLINGNIIDLGAWIGDNSIPWAMNVSHTIYAIDPSNDNINYIEDMAKANNIIEEKVDFIPVARPAIILVAAPVEEFLTMFKTGFFPRAV